MGTCIIGSENGVTFIQCQRGQEKPRHKVISKNGTELYVLCTKEEFNRYEESRSVPCIRVDDSQKTKYRKSHLKWVD